MTINEPTHTETAIRVTKQFRKTLDGTLQELKAQMSGSYEIGKRTSRERSLAVTKLQECIMWLGMDLKDLADTDPYPNSKDPSNTIVDPTADGLKL